MAIFTISLNQFIEASKASTRGKTRIVKQQIVVNKFLTPWYQLAKNRIKLYFKNVTDKDVLRKAIQDLKNKVPKDENAKKNINVSIEAIYKVMGVGFENILAGGYEVITPNFKNIEIEDVNINVNPDLIFRYFEDGLVKIGGLKFHVSKSKPFDLQQSKHIANIIRMYLNEKIAEKEEVVDYKLCWAYDVFTDRLTQSDENYNVTAIEAKKLSWELVQIYNQL